MPYVVALWEAMEKEKRWSRASSNTMDDQVWLYSNFEGCETLKHLPRGIAVESIFNEAKEDGLDSESHTIGIQCSSVYHCSMPYFGSFTVLRVALPRRNHDP